MPSWEKMTATITVAKSSKKPSTHRWMIQNRQVSTTEKWLELSKNMAGR